MSAIRDGKRGCESRDIASYVRAKRSARKRHTRRAAVACVQLHADDDEADSGQGFIIPFRFFPQPCCDKTETQRVTIQHADVQKASCGRAAALPQTRCHSLKEKRHHKRILRPLSTETIGCRAPIGSLSCSFRPQQYEASMTPPPLPSCRLLQTPTMPAFPRLQHRKVLLRRCLEVGCKGFCSGQCCCI